MLEGWIGYKVGVFIIRIGRGKWVDREGGDGVPGFDSQIVLAEYTLGNPLIVIYLPIA